MPDKDPVVILGGVDSAPKLLESASGLSSTAARDWFDDRAAALGDFSFQLHRQLAESFDGQKRWGYAGSHVYSLSLDDAPAGVRGEDWLLAGTSRAQAVGRRAYGHASAAGERASWNVVASAEDCAQVEPRKLCKFLLSECQQRGVRLLLGTRATEVVKSGDGKVSVLKLESTTGGTGPTLLYCSDIVITAGCWAPRVFNTLFPQSRIKMETDALAGHSILYRSPRYTRPFLNIVYGQDDKFHGKDKHIPYAIYCPPTKSWSYSPETYAPAKAAVQLSGLKGRDDKPAEDDSEIISKALCFRPVSKSGVPIIGKVSPRDLVRVFIQHPERRCGSQVNMGHGVNASSSK
ncbi:hypothetical protein K469DRAFT_738710 [Zopfia rhizophila CBS 207.26]|uniref:FAD dependent oxidoreductase domain-containing protein n=1 Tax=Zopfia rhizophila CBS 207.26 TaxID=1314779 RepID=A0A6A6E4S7_9PEZI|nr:hypothetical protein K469DRAFT_738710 [Zopfia rhizophila CBS 207.26]